MAVSRTAVVLTAIVVVTSLNVSACKKQGSNSNQSDDTTLRVLSQNLFIGSNMLGFARIDLRRMNPLQALALARHKADRMMKSIRFHDFPARARGFAEQVKKYNPDVICLQEVGLIETHTRRIKGKYSAKKAGEKYDYMHTLMRELKNKNLNYRLVVIKNTTDETIPSRKNGMIRLVDRLAILSRSDLEIEGSEAQLYKSRWTKPFFIRTVTLKKGWVRADLKKNGKLFRIVNTHLERLGDYKKWQNRELQAKFLPKSTRHEIKRPTIIVGDFNADPGREPDMVRPWKSNYVDVWSFLRDRTPHTREEGGTCCFEIPLVDTAHFPGSRFDIILASRGLQPLRIKRVHNWAIAKASRRGRLRISDHTGLLADFSFRADTPKRNN